MVCYPLCILTLPVMQPLFTALIFKARPVFVSPVLNHQCRKNLQHSYEEGLCVEALQSYCAFLLFLFLPVLPTSASFQHGVRI